MARGNKNNPNGKTSASSSSKNDSSTPKATKKKKKKVVISHIVKPEKMSLEEWQVKLRQ